MILIIVTKLATSTVSAKRKAKDCRQCNSAHYQRITNQALSSYNSIVESQATDFKSHTQEAHSVQKFSQSRKEEFIVCS